MTEERALTDGKDGAIGYAYADPDLERTVLCSTLEGALKYYRKVQARKKPHVNIHVMVCYHNIQIGTINIDKLGAEISRRQGG
jgi:hypothetical protein